MTSPLARSTPGRPARLLRWAGCDRNPLRRTTERIEAWALLLAIISYVPLAMVAAGYAGHWAHAAGVRAQHALRPRLVAAVVLTAAHATRPMAARVPVRWTIGSRTRTGAVPVSYGTPAGAVVRVSGRPSRPCHHAAPDHRAAQRSGPHSRSGHAGAHGPAPRAVAVRTALVPEQTTARPMGLRLVVDRSAISALTRTTAPDQG